MTTTMMMTKTMMMTVGQYVGTLFTTEDGQRSSLSSTAQDVGWRPLLQSILGGQIQACQSADAEQVAKYIRMQAHFSWTCQSALFRLTAKIKKMNE